MSRVVVASDHAGFPLKAQLARWLSEHGHDVQDLGAFAPQPPVDYPPVCAAAARVVVAGDADFGLVVGGSGQGEAISANKVHGARAALCHDEYTARYARLHNNANVLSMGARLIAPELAESILEVFLTTEFEGGRHIPRLEEIAAIEREECDRTSDPSR
jgi:ribose 5-phosphate isomerase B